MSVQNIIQFEKTQKPSFESFIIGKNHEIINHLQACSSGKKHPFIFLWGAQDLGKSHLLKACQRLAAETKQAAYYSISDPSANITQLLTHNHYQLLCLDDIDAVIGKLNWEHALFALFNEIRDQQHSLIVSAKNPPQHIAFQLADLSTRMGWGLVLKLHALNDQQRICALSRMAHQSGFEINDQVGSYMLNHYSRDWPTLLKLLNHIENETLSQKRKLTLPFLKQILEQHEP